MNRFFLSALALCSFAMAPATAQEPAPAADPAAIAVFHDFPFPHPVSLILRKIDIATGEFGPVNINVASTDFAAGSGRIRVADDEATLHQFHAVVLEPGTYAMIGKTERIPEGNVVKAWLTCFPKGADIFTVEASDRVLVKAPTSMTFDPAHMQSQIEQFLKAGEAGQLEKDFAAVLAANPSFGGEYRTATPERAVAFKMQKSAADGIDCLKPGAAKGKIVAQ